MQCACSNSCAIAIASVERDACGVLFGLHAQLQDASSDSSNMQQESPTTLTPIFFCHHNFIAAAYAGPG
jgi:hypothetical protein